MKHIALMVIFLLTSCSAIPTPNDFPPPPMTVIVEVPPATATVTLEPRMRPVLSENRQAAETFFLIIKTSLAAGDDAGIAEKVKYPLSVQLNGQIFLLKDKTEFLDQYATIFDAQLVNTLYVMNENNLSLLPNGVRVGEGELWFNYFCVDLTCSEAQFLITQINQQ